MGLAEQYFEKLEDPQKTMDPKIYNIMLKTAWETVKYLDPDHRLGLGENMRFFTKAGFNADKALEVRKEYYNQVEIDYRVNMEVKRRLKDMELKT